MVGRRLERKAIGREMKERKRRSLLTFSLEGREYFEHDMNGISDSQDPD